MVKGDIGGEGPKFGELRSLAERTTRDLSDEVQGRREPIGSVTRPVPPLIRFGDFEVAEECKELLASGKSVPVTDLHRPALGGQGEPVIYHVWDDGTLCEKSPARVIVRLPENGRIETALSEGSATTENASSIRKWLQKVLRLVTRGDDPATEQAHSMSRATLHTILGYQEIRSMYNDMLLDPETRLNLARKAIREDPEKLEVISGLMELEIARNDPELARLVSDLDVEAKPLSDEDLARVLGENPEKAEVINKLEELKRRVQGDVRLARFVGDLKAGAFPPRDEDLARALNELEEKLPYSELRFDIDAIQFILDKQKRPVGIKIEYDPYSSYFQHQALANDEREFSYKTGALVAMVTSDKKIAIGLRREDMDKGGVWGGVAEALSKEDRQDPRRAESTSVEALSRQYGPGSEQVKEELIREAREELEQAKNSPPDPNKNVLRGMEEEMGIFLQDIVGLEEGVHFDIVQEWVPGERIHRGKNVLREGVRLEDVIHHRLVLGNHDRGTDFATEVEVRKTSDGLKESWSRAHDGREATKISFIDISSAEAFARDMIPDDGPRIFLHGVQELMRDIAYRRFGENAVKDALLDRQWEVSGVTSAEKFAEYMIINDGSRRWSPKAQERLYEKANQRFGEGRVRRAMLARQLRMGYEAAP